MLKLRNLKLRNWGYIREAELEFPDCGLVLVVGNNSVATGGKFQSIGAGKTLVGEALSRALAGVNGRFTNLGWYANEKEGSKNMLVEVSASVDGTDLGVLMGYKCSELSRTGEGFKFTFGGKEVHRAKIDATRKELYDLLKISPELADWTVFLDGDKLSFNSLSEKRAVELLMTALEQPPWNVYQERAAKTLSTCRGGVHAAEASHAEAERNVLTTKDRMIKASEALKAEQRTFNSLKVEADRRIVALKSELEDASAKAEECTQRKRNAAAQIKRIEDEHADEHARLEKRVLDYVSKVSDARRRRSEKADPRANAKANLRSAEAHLKAVVEGKTCPSCRQKLPKTEGELERAREKCASAQDLFSKLDSDVSELDQSLAELEAELERRRAELNRLNVAGLTRELSEEFDQADQDLQQATRKVTRLSTTLESEKGPSRRGLDSAEAVLKERTEAHQEAQQRVIETAQKLSDAHETVKVVQYWADGFGPSGIPNMILKRSIGPLNLVSQRLSASLTGSTIVVGYDTARELSTGRERAELVIKVQNALGSKRPEGGSKGETGLVNLIVAETLSEIGRVPQRMGFAWYDEIVKGQDPVVRGSIYAHLKRKAQELGILVFVVDHHQESVNFADHVLMVDKTTDGATLRWA